MDSDDDFDIFSPPEVPSPPSNGRKLKRLKRAAEVPSDHSPAEPPVKISTETAFDSLMSLSGNIEESSVQVELDETSDLLQQEQQQPSESGISGFEGSKGESPSGSENFEEEGEVKRRLVFDSVAVEGDRRESGEAREEDEDLVLEQPNEKSHDLELLQTNGDEKRKKKKRDQNGGDDNEEIEEPATNKRREEKERRGHLKHLHADCQRVLRETRDASFKPIPIVQKPISSVLEKIKQRKLEISQKKENFAVKTTTLVSRFIEFSDDDDDVDADVDFNPLDFTVQKGNQKNVAQAVADELMTDPAETKTALDATPMTKPVDKVDQPSSSKINVQKTSQGEFRQAFRAPIDDTQELFYDYQTNETKDESLIDSPGSPVEEDFAPSVLVMKLKLDSAPQISDDDEEENDKENVDPHVHEVDVSLPLKDPVRDFLDEEAEEEDDSDNDPFQGQENEEDEEDSEDAQELNDMIAADYDEKPIESEKRNELHQKWLEQQDAAGMENLLQRIKGGLKERETALLEDEDDQDEEVDSDDDAEQLNPQLNLRRVKQMIPQMFTDKDDPYVSSDDEEPVRSLAKQSLFKKAEGQSTFLSPEEDDSSREVFRRIKKLNIMPDAKRRAKTSALRDSLQTGGAMNGFQKPSFLGRGSNSSMPSKNHKTSAVRSFIFSREDGSSRSSIAAPEELDPPQKESRPKKAPSAKFSSSQSTFSNTQTSMVSDGGSSAASLYDILRRSSLRSEHRVPETEDVRTESMFAAFRVEKRSRGRRIPTYS